MRIPDSEMYRRTVHPYTMEQAPKLRVDLIVHEQVGEDSADEIVLNDPVSGKYYRISRYEYRLLKSLDGSRSIEQAVEELASKGHYYSIDNSKAVVGKAAQFGLVLGTKFSTAQFQLNLKESRKKAETARRFSSVYYLFLPLLNPDRFLERTLWIAGLIANRWTGLLVALAAPGAIYLAVAGLPRMRLEYLFFFNWRNLLYLWITIALTKLIHEFAHAYTAKHYGLSVPEMGLAVLIFFPCLYCNTTDAWQLADRRQRAAIAGAGILAEAVLAVVSTYVWHFSRPGLLNSLAFYLMAVSFGSTVLFNGNPLLKFDGYFLLIDFLGMPNLAGNARKYLRYLFLNRVLGNELVGNPARSEREAAIFAWYGTAAVLYRIALYLAIVTGVYYRFDKMLGIALAAMAIVLFIFRPLWLGAKSLYSTREMMKPRPRSLALFLGGIALMLTVLCVTWSGKSVYPCFVTAARTQKLTVPLHSLVEAVYIRDGSRVHRGDLLFRLDTSQLRLKMLTKKTERAVLSEEIRLLLLDDESLGKAEAKKIELKQVEDEIRFLKDQLALARSSRAPFDGVVTGLDPRLQAGFQPGRGVVVGRLLSTNQRVVHALVPAADVDKVRPGKPVEIWFPVGEGLILKREVHSVKSYSERDLRDSPFSSRVGGELATEVRGKDRREAPLEAQYDCSINLGKEAAAIPFGMTGRVAVASPPRSVLARVYRYVLRTFNRESFL